jgi:hypothetical protein
MSRLRNVDFSASPPPSRPFSRRLLGALTLDATVYEEVEHHPEALRQALAVVGIAALARGLGEGDLVFGTLAGIAGWLLGTAIVWLIGVVLLRNSSSFPELLRTLGFATAPYALSALGALPLGSLDVALALGVWALSLVAWVIAVRQALDVSMGYALAVCLAALVPNLFVVLLIDAARLIAFAG